MWAFVYEVEGGYTKDFDNNLNVRVDDGQYFFQDEGSSGIFWTYDRQRGGYKRVAGAENTKYPGVWYFIDVLIRKFRFKNRLFAWIHLIACGMADLTAILAACIQAVVRFIACVPIFRFI